jgi:hypothetical protein
MTLEKFWGMALEDDEDDFDYGRDFLKDANYDDILELESMPYQCIPLFLYPDWFGSSKPKKFI